MHCVLETLWRTEINQVVALACAKSLWRKGAWPIRRAEKMFTWLQQRARASCMQREEEEL